MDHRHHNNIKAVLGFMIVLLAAAILGLFVMYQDSIMEAGNYTLFLVLTSIGMGLLIVLFFLASKPHHAAPARHAHHSAKKAKKGSSKKKK